MMETILITGAGPNSITGKRIKEQLEGEYTLLTPSSKEIDLTDKEAVDNFFKTYKIDYVVHCAVKYPQKGDLPVEKDYNFIMFENLSEHSKEFKKMIYFGSGAEYGKQRDIRDITEDKINEIIPCDRYGYSKLQMNKIARQSDNIYNFRLFGTINPYELPIKNVVSNICAKAILGMPIVLQKDCLFSFVDIDDVVSSLKFSLRNSLRYHDYNITGDRYYALSHIAKLAKRISKCKGEICFMNEGMNLEYTGNNSRWKEEYSFRFTEIAKSLSKVYSYLITEKETIIQYSKVFDSRWESYGNKSV